MKLSAQKHLIWGLALLTALAHSLAALALAAFGWRADGYVLNGPASYIYLALTLMAVCFCLVIWRRKNDWALAWNVVLPMGLPLAAAAVWFATTLFGAKYATWGALTDDDGLFALINLAYALLGCGLALGLRWPRLLLAWAMAHGLIVLLCPFVAIAPPNLYEILPWLFVTPAYGLAAWALGWQPNRRVVSMVLGAGTFAVVAPLVMSLVGSDTSFASYSLLGAEVVWSAAALLPLGLYAWRARREWETAALEQSPSAPWMAAALTLVCGALLAGYLLGPPMLPRAGEAQPWISNTHIVPVAWLPTLAWSAWLFDVLPWLAGLLVLGGVVSGLRARPMLSLGTVNGLVWLGITLLLGWGMDSLSPLRFILNVTSEGFTSLLDWLGPLIAALGLLFIARQWERGRRPVWVLAVFLLLSLFLWLQAEMAWPYARFLFFPQPDWASVGEYAPLPPALLAGAGLALHVGLGGFGLYVVGQWIGIARGETTLAPALRRAALVGGSGVAIVYAAWYVLTTPRLIQAVPAPDAINIPRDALIVIGLALLTPLDDLWAGGLYGSMSARYADTGEYIPASSGSRGAGVFVLAPATPLRANVVIVVTVIYGNKRPYILRFTTGGANTPSATPLPEVPEQLRPVPTDTQ